MKAAYPDDQAGQFAAGEARARQTKRGQRAVGMVNELKSLMSSFLRAVERLAACGAVLAFPTAFTVAAARDPFAAGGHGGRGSTASRAARMPGDQGSSRWASVTPAGGFAAWQDNNIDGDGFGIAAVKIDQSLSPAGGVFRVNVSGAGDQVAPQIAALANGGAAIVWQGAGGPGSREFRSRFEANGGTFTTTNDILSQREHEPLPRLLRRLPPLRTEA